MNLSGGGSGGGDVDGLLTSSSSSMTRSRRGFLMNDAGVEADGRLGELVRAARGLSDFTGGFLSALEGVVDVFHGRRLPIAALRVVD